MVLSKAQIKALRKRYEGVSDVGGVAAAAKEVGITKMSIYKILDGGNVRTKTVESALAGLLALEAKQEKLKEEVGELLAA